MIPSVKSKGVFRCIRLYRFLSGILRHLADSHKTGLENLIPILEGYGITCFLVSFMEGSHIISVETWGVVYDPVRIILLFRTVQESCRIFVPVLVCNTDVGDNFLGRINKLNSIAVDMIIVGRHRSAVDIFFIVACQNEVTEVIFAFRDQYILIRSQGLGRFLIIKVLQRFCNDLCEFQPVILAVDLQGIEQELLPCSFM